MPKEVSAGGLTLHLRRRELLHPGPLRYESLIQAACHTIPIRALLLPSSAPSCICLENAVMCGGDEEPSFARLDGRDVRPHTIFPGRNLI